MTTLILLSVGVPHTMFKTMYAFWTNNVLKNNLVSRLNLWFLSNIRLFLNSSKFGISLLLSALSNFKLRSIKTIKLNSNFMDIYNTYVVIFIYLLFILVATILL